MNAFDFRLSGICNWHTQDLPVVMPHVVHIENTDGSGLDQTACERRLLHDHHGIEGRSILREGVGNESIVKGVTHR